MMKNYDISRYQRRYLDIDDEAEAMNARRCGCNNSCRSCRPCGCGQNNGGCGCNNGCNNNEWWNRPRMAHISGRVMIDYRRGCLGENGEEAVEDMGRCGCGCNNGCNNNPWNRPRMAHISGRVMIDYRNGCGFEGAEFDDDFEEAEEFNEDCGCVR